MPGRYRSPANVMNAYDADPRPISNGFLWHVIGNRIVTMIKNYLLITLRGMAKNKLFIVINVFGMAIAIACCIVAYFAYEYDATFDAVHANRASLYRVSAVREFEGTLTRVGYASLPLGEIVDKTFADVDRSSRYIYSASNFKRADDLFPANAAYVDPGFFRMFTFDFIEGDPAALNDKTSVFVSETMAVRLFGTASAAQGKTITQVYGTALKELKIAGVFREPAPNSSFYRKEGSAYLNFDNHKDEFPNVRHDDWRHEATLFVQINDATRVEGVHRQLQAFRASNNQAREDFQVAEFRLDPLTSLAASDRADDVRAATWAAPPLPAITGAVVMAVLLLLIACFNLTNTSIAISSRRLKEIGIRKVMGSMRMQLIVQFIGETTLVCFLSLIVALGIADLLIEGWNIITDNNIRLSPHYFDAPGFMLFLMAVLLLTGILAGSYPAFYVSRFEPVTILKGKVRLGGTNYFTRILLGLQFAFSLIAIVNGIGFLQNARYQKNYHLGFDVRGSIVATVGDQREFDTYRNALQGNPQILSIAGAASGIFSNRLHEPVEHGSRQIEVDIIGVGDNYLATLDLRLVEGRDFIKDSETDQKESIIITEKMAKVFGWDKPLGKSILWKDSVRLFVVGVVRDVYTHGLWKEMEPMMIRYVSPAQYSQIVVSTRPEQVVAVDGYMKKQWSEVFPNRLYNGRMLVSQLDQVVDLNLSIMYMYMFLGGIALLLSVTGLFTLVSLNIIRRMKEIGVRKVLGASVPNIARIVNTEFVIILILASVLGSWSSYTMSGVIMSSIWKYYQGVNALTFVSAVGLLFAVSFVAIGYKIFSVSMINPVNTLRDE